MNEPQVDAYEAVVDAVAKEEGRMAPKKRLAILSALSCFAEYGFDGTSTKMIAERAGIGEATIFRHFPTKQDLLIRIATPVIRHILTPAAEAQAHELLESHKAEPRLIIRAVMLGRLEFMTRYAPLVRIAIQEALVNADLRALIQREAAPLFVQVSGIIDLLGAASDAERQRFIRLIGSLIGGYFIHKTIISPEQDWNDDVEVDRILDVLFDGLPATVSH